MTFRRTVLAVAAIAMCFVSSTFATIEMLVFTCGGDVSDICAMLPDGSNRVNLTNTPGVSEFYVDIQRSGSRKIVFAAVPDGILTGKIYVMDTDGSNVTPLTETILQPGTPAWSPDNSKIAFGARIDGDFDIYVMNSDGSGRVKLTDNDAADSGPVFSPDGQKILFSSSRDGDTEIYIMNADGTDPTRLTYSAGFDQNPHSDPSGNGIVFASDRTGSFEIYTMNVDGSGQTAITSGTGYRNYQPRYGPGGHRIAFATDRDGDHEIYLMKPDGTEVTRVTNDPGTDANPAWSIASDSVSSESSWLAGTVMSMPSMTESYSSSLLTS